MVKETNKYTFEPDYAVAPGETLRETMEALDMRQKELAISTGLTVQSLIRIFKGEQPISYETAIRLELAVGIPASMWNNLEALYREQLAEDLVCKARSMLLNNNKKPGLHRVFCLIETVKVHYFVPNRYKVVQKLLLGILISVDFRQGPELGI